MRWFSEKIRNWSLKDKVAQTIMIDLSGEDDLDLISEYNWAGVILFSKNVRSPEQVYELNQRIYKCSKFMPFIAIDQEGGTVFRIDFDSYPAPPSNMAIARISDLYAAKIVASINARLLKTLGFNLNFAPVLDVNYNPYNPIINVRAFSSEPLKVSLYGKYAISGYKEEEMIAVGKHFPGHGSTYQDSHLELPTVDKTLEELEAQDIFPFRECIEKAGLDAIMTAHVLYPKIDHRPATLSPKILGYLREKLGFNKVVFSDALNMLALKNYSQDTILIEAFNAGCDVLLVLSEDRQTKLDAVEIMVNAVKRGFIDRARLDEALHRILRLKRKYLMTWSDVDFEDKESLQDSVRLLERITEKTVEFKRNRQFKAKLERALILLTTAGLRTGIHNYIAQLISASSDLKVELLVVEQIDKLNVDAYSGLGLLLVSLLRTRPSNRLKNFLNELIARAKDFVLLNLANPYLDQDLGREPAVLVNSFGYNRLSCKVAWKKLVENLSLEKYGVITQL